MCYRNCCKGTGDAQERSNYKDFKLINHYINVPEKVIAQEIRKNMIYEMQFGFVSLVPSLSEITAGKVLRKCRPLYIAFIDLERRNLMYYVLKSGSYLETLWINELLKPARQRNSDIFSKEFCI